MTEHEKPAGTLHGLYRDVLRDDRGRVVWERDWRANTIVGDFRRLLAGFVRGTPTSTEGIVGLRVGAGSDTWDAAPPPSPPPGTTSLVDANPHTVPRSDLTFEYLVGGAASAAPTNRLQIVASLGPNVPPWPDPNHASATLREFGLVGRLDGADVLLNYVIHPAIAKDPASTLQRTIWLVF